MEQSRAPGNYNLSSRIHADSCYMEHSGYLEGNKDKGILASNIDTESELKNLNYKNSKCTQHRYKPKNAFKKSDLTKKQQCPLQLIPNETRQPKTCNGLSSININRFEPLCLDSQKLSRIHTNDYNGQPTRLIMKDITTKMRKKLNNK